MKWKTIRDECLQWMYTYSKKGAVIPETDGNNKDLILAMPAAANIIICDILRVYPNVKVYSAEKGQAAAEYDMKDILGKKFMRFADNYTDADLPCRILPDGHTLYASEGDAGTIRIYYHEAPEEITRETADGYEPDLPIDAAVLVPLGMAAEIYKEDEESIAATIWNEYAQRLGALGAGTNRAGDAAYVTVTGWIR